MDTYKATNTTNGKFYIGSTNNFENRKREHLRSRENYPFQSALRKNPDAFEWEVWSDDCDEPVLEQALLDTWFGKECCYNLNPSATRPPSWEGRTGDIWWNDGKINKRSAECPGEGWTQGVIREESAKHLDSVRSIGETPWWTNGTSNKRSWECPGEGWERGMTKRVFSVSGNFYEKWWTNGINNRRCAECPGEGWQEGVTSKQPSSRPVRVTTLDTGEVLDFPSVCAAARHYGVRDSKLGSVARGLQKQHKGLQVIFI
jgi:hypothetical protein